MSDTLGMYLPAARADVGAARSTLRDPKAPGVPVELDALHFAPRGARQFLMQLYGTAGGAAVASAAPKLSAYTEDFHPDGLDARLPRGEFSGAGQIYAERSDNYWGWHADRSQLFAAGLADSGAARVTADPVDATAALLTYDLADTGERSHSYTRVEDRTNGLTLRFGVERDRDYGQDGAPHYVRLAITLERAEGAAAVLADERTPAGEWPNGFTGNLGAGRAVRLGFDTDGALRLEVQHSAPGVLPVVWHGLTGVRLPPLVADVFNPARVYLHFEAWTAAYSELGIANVRGSRPLGPVVAPGDLPTLTRPLVTPVGTPDRKALCVPNGMRGTLDRVAVSLLVLAAAGDASGAAHAVADAWVTIRVDGSPVQGLAQLRPSSLLAGQGAPAGAILSTAVRPALDLRGGQQVTAEITVRDSSAGHPVEVLLAGWLYEDAGA